MVVAAGAAEDVVDVTFLHDGEPIWPTVPWQFSAADQAISYRGKVGESAIPFTAQFSVYIDDDYRNVYGIVIVGDPEGAGVWSGGPDDPAPGPSSNAGD